METAFFGAVIIYMVALLVATILMIAWKIICIPFYVARALWRALRRHHTRHHTRHVALQHQARAIADNRHPTNQDF